MTDKRSAVEIAEDLLGSCEYFDLMDLSCEDITTIETITMRCETCGWWCDPDEINFDEFDEPFCNDCLEQA